MFDGLTTQLLNGLAQQLCDFWKKPEVGSAEIMPLWYGSKPLFIEDMLSREAKGMTVDRPLLHEESWRT